MFRFRLGPAGAAEVAGFASWLAPGSVSFCVSNAWMVPMAVWSSPLYAPTWAWRSLTSSPAFRRSVIWCCRPAIFAVLIFTCARGMTSALSIAACAVRTL